MYEKDAHKTALAEAQKNIKKSTEETSTVRSENKALERENVSLQAENKRLKEAKPPKQTADKGDKVKIDALQSQVEPHLSPNPNPNSNPNTITTNMTCLNGRF